MIGSVQSPNKNNLEYRSMKFTWTQTEIHGLTINIYVYCRRLVKRVYRKYVSYNLTILQSYN